MELNGSREKVVTLPHFIRPRHVQDVPEDVDFLMDHLNDPNYDLRHRSQSSIVSSETLVIKKGAELSPAFTIKSTDLDTESQVDSTQSPMASKMPDLSTFDEYGNSLPFWNTLINNSISESPYPEVRASVSSIDDTTMPVNTFRMWFLGLVYIVVLSGLNQFFSFRCMLPFYRLSRC
jgi:hypothetical protein